MALDFALARPQTEANIFGSYQAGQDMQQKSFENAAKREEMGLKLQEKRSALTEQQRTLEIMRDFALEQKNATEAIASPLENAERAEKAAGQLLAIGNFKAAEELYKASKESRDLAKDRIGMKQEETKTLLDNAGKTALTAYHDPSPLNLSEAKSAFYASGGNPKVWTTAENDPNKESAVRALLKDQALQSMTAVDRIKFEDAQAEHARQDADRDRDAAERARAARARERRAAQRMDEDGVSVMTPAQIASHSRSINNELVTITKPLREDLDKISLQKQYLATSSPESAQQLRQTLAGGLGKFVGRSASLFYKDNKYFGSLDQKMSTLASSIASGMPTEETRKQWYIMLNDIETKLVTPALEAAEYKAKQRGKVLGLPPDAIGLLGATTAPDNAPVPPKADGGAPAGKEGKALAPMSQADFAKYEKVNGKWQLKAQQ